jgi:hypothetical protein
MRLAGLVKGGFYPAPDEAVDLVAAALRALAAPFALLDPCAGEGQAVRRLAGLLGCRPAGVHALELDTDRAERLHANLPGARVLGPASCFGCAITPGSFSLVWCNPPYDDHFGGGRVEADFARRATELLRPGGVLALACPESVADRWDVRRLLLQWYEQVSVRPFPEACRQYHEVVVLGVRRRQPVEYWDADWQAIQAPEGFVYDLPPSDGPRRFEKVEMTDAELTRALAASPLRRLLAEAPAPAVPAPALALGAGHVALLLASGHLDGVVRPAHEPPHIVRGTARKVEYISAVETTENEAGDETVKTTVSQKIQLVVRAVGPDGIIRTFAEE